MHKLNVTFYLPDGWSKIFEDVKGIEQQNERQISFLCASNNEGLRSVTINLDRVIGYEIEGIIPQQSEEDDEDDPNEGED